MSSQPRRVFRLDYRSATKVLGTGGAGYLGSVTVTDLDHPDLESPSTWQRAWLSGAQLLPAVEQQRVTAIRG